MFQQRYQSTTAEFRTADIGLVAFLICSGYELLEYVLRDIPGGKRKTIYTLNNSPALMKSVEDYFAHRVSMSPYKHSQKVYELIQGTKELK